MAYAFVEQSPLDQMLDVVTHTKAGFDSLKMPKYHFLFLLQQTNSLFPWQVLPWNANTHSAAGYLRDVHLLPVMEYEVVCSHCA